MAQSHPGVLLAHWQTFLLCTIAFFHLVSAIIEAHNQGFSQLIERAYRDWGAYKDIHTGLRFTDEMEEYEHILAFLSAQRLAEQHNEAYARGEVSFLLDAWNPLAHLPIEEYKRTRTGYRSPAGLSPLTVKKNYSRFLPPLNSGELPAAVDWREHSYVTPVKDQGVCGSCWAFSATGSLEGQHKRATGELILLSEQNLVDCASPYGTAGCDGGWIDDAFNYIKANKGLDGDQYYPYSGYVQRCMFEPWGVRATLTGYVDLPNGDEQPLKVAVATQGPVSVVIDASHKSFELYKSGVYDEKNCSVEDLDHAVLVVGYGTDPLHGDYWLVKNSWGANWGEAGYVRMARNKGNQCGIATKASYPLV